MFLRPVVNAARRTTLTTFTVLQSNHHIEKKFLGNASAQRLSRAGCFAVLREVSTVTKKDKKSEVNWSLKEKAIAGKAIDGVLKPRVGQLLEEIEKSRVAGDSKRELKQLLKLYNVLKARNQQDADVFEALFCIAQVYDAQLENRETAKKYYEEALEVLKVISTEETAWGDYMRLTTLGALALCHENLGNVEKAATYFEDAIEAYEKHCNLASASGNGEDDISTFDVSLLTDLNATAAMIHYYYAGNLLAQNCGEEAKTVTKIALTLAENSSMPLESLEEMQHCIHDLWLEMD